MTAASRAADAAIRAYQTRLSPRKGWSCAARVRHGGPSCSAAVRDIIRERGVLRALGPTAARFLLCFQAAVALAPVEVEGRGVCCCGGIPIPIRF